MSTPIPPEFLDFLIAIGESGRLDDCLQIPDKFPGLRSGQVMRLHFADWYAVADALETGRLVALIKALTVAERIVPGFKAGSVSAVIWLFRKLAERAYPESGALASWIVANTDNGYLPYGSLRTSERQRTE